MGVLLMVGTRKGLFLLRGDENRSSWELEGPLLTGWSVFHATQDPRDGSLYVAGNNFVYGGTEQRLIVRIRPDRVTTYGLDD